VKKEDVHLQLSEELVGIDAELDRAMEALSATNFRIDAFLNEGNIDEAMASASSSAGKIEDEDEEDEESGSSEDSEDAVESSEMQDIEDIEDVA
jgi:hypothetical protein